MHFVYFLRQFFRKPTKIALQETTIGKVTTKVQLAFLEISQIVTADVVRSLLPVYLKTNWDKKMLFWPNSD